MSNTSPISECLRMSTRLLLLVRMHIVNYYLTLMSAEIIYTDLYYLTKLHGSLCHIEMADEIDECGPGSVPKNIPRV